MRVVLDTNVWISGSLWRGAPMQVVHRVETNEIEAWATIEMLQELEETLAYPRLAPRLFELKWSVADVMTVVTAQISLTELSEIERAAPEDADDDIFPNCARAIAANYLISGTKHLLRLKEWAGIPIVTPREFLERQFPELLTEKESE